MTRVTRSGRSGLEVLAIGGLLLATAGCGARWSGAQQATITRSDQASVGGSASSGGAGTSRVESTAGTAGAGDVRADAGAPREGDGGANAVSSVGADQRGASACSATSTAPGVTSKEITVGSISSLSGPVPGLGASAAAATRAYVAFRNSTGGVCGRRIVLREADDTTDNGQYRSVVSDMSTQVLGIAGGFALGDVGGTSIVRERALPVVNVPSGDAVSELPTVFDMNPPVADPNGVIGKYRYLRAQGARTVAMAYLAVDQSRAEALTQRHLMEAAGMTIVSVQELPLSTLSYDPAARGVAKSGADYLFFIGDTHGNAAMAKAMADTGYHLNTAEYLTFAYGTSFIEQAGAAANGAVTWLRVLPNEDAGGNEEVATYLQWMARVAPTAARDEFAADAWAGTRAFFDALEALPGPITRAALVAQLQSVDVYDAGGMLGPIHLGRERTNACLVAMRVESGAWKRLAPAKGFLCS